MTPPFLLRVFALALLLVLLGGCTAPTLDAGSAAAWSESVQDVREDLVDSERMRFDRALQQLAPSPDTDAAAVPNRALNGLRAAEVMRLAEQGQVEQGRLSREQARQEIARLEAFKAKVEAEQGRVDGFRITSARFYKQELGDTGVIQPFIRVTLDNGSGLTVVRVVATGTLRSGGRDQPWLRQTVAFPVFGGMPPGKKHETLLRPGPYSEWGQVDAPADVRLDLDLVSVETSDGRTWLAKSAFTPEDAKQLRELKAVED